MWTQTFQGLVKVLFLPLVSSRVFQPYHYAPFGPTDCLLWGPPVIVGHLVAYWTFTHQILAAVSLPRL